MIKAIIFDFGNVVFKTDWDKMHEEFSKKYNIRTSLSENKEFEEVYHKTNAGYDTTIPLLKHMLPNEDINEVLKFYQETYIKYKILNKELMNLIKKLKETYLIYGFTDTNREHFDANEKDGLFKNFKRVFTSFEFQGRKSQGADIFHKLLKEINLPADELLFIDDNLPNIENARKAGLNAIQYTDFPDIARLKKDLKNLIKI
jgi:HAD superfamily hydrolase (TIGR01509 family)